MRPVEMAGIGLRVRLAALSKSFPLEVHEATLACDAHSMPIAPMSGCRPTGCRYLASSKIPIGLKDAEAQG
jgi:hypothetical protein